jgi:hypothetical protein
MNRADTAELLALCAAFDRRTVGKADVVAWQKLLAHYAYEDAEAAVNEHYSSEHRWIMPADVIRIVRRIRAQRITDAVLVYDGNPDESGLDSARSLRQLQRAAGDGKVGPRTALQAIPDRRPLELEAGKRTTRLKEAFAAIGSMPPPIVPGVTNPLAVGCPHCKAAPARPCRTKIGKRSLADPHPARVERARQAAAGLDEQDTAS